MNLSTTNDKKSSYGDLIWLYCGNNLSEDDFVWSVECSATDLFYLFTGPKKWVDGLSDVPDTRNVATIGKKRIDLLKHFTVQMVYASPKTPRILKKGSVQLDGISDTAILRIVASEDSPEPLIMKVIQEAEAYFHQAGGGLSATSKETPQQALANLRAAIESPRSGPPQDWFALYWLFVASVLQSGNGVPSVVVDGDNSRWFGHLQIFHPSWGWPKSFRDSWCAAYLLMRLVDSKEYAKTFLASFGWTVVPVDLSKAPDQDPVTLPIDSTNDVSFTYAGEDGSDDEICDIQFGYLDENGYWVQNGTIKNYTTPHPHP